MEYINESRKSSASASANNLSVKGLKTTVISAVEQVIASENFITKLATRLSEKLQIKNTEILYDVNKRVLVLEDENKKLKNELRQLRSTVSDLQHNSLIADITTEMDISNNDRIVRVGRSQVLKKNLAFEQIQSSKSTEKFEKLLNQVRALSINTEEQMQSVIDMFFEKAIDDPNFSAPFALLSRELALMQVPANSASDDKNGPKYVNFRQLLITKCQKVFENSSNENCRNLKLKEIEECTDPEKRNELQLLLEKDDRKMHIRSVETMIIIGELFKNQLITVRIILRCINILLDDKDNEDNLECLCMLLTTVGKDLELAKNQNLNHYFQIMQQIVNRKPDKISSRVRFMLQDVIDLRNSKWVPRSRQDDTELMNVQVVNSGPMSIPRKVDSDHKRQNLSMAGPRNRTTYTVESSKLLKNPPEVEELTLGLKKIVGKEGCDSTMKTQHTQTPPISNTTNMSDALDNASDQTTSQSSCESQPNKDLSVSQETSMEPTAYDKDGEDNRGSCSGSQQQKLETTPASASALDAFANDQTELEELQLRMRKIMHEYFT